ncbi:DUF4239 domain-containing protein [Kitasatospora sp. LaBMicrA B282]|uniref:bestrophin-like domain n=1 Tax=Kitasatospora sp. LaBMicrA B282 TaxID=3420949 RepID=UPI003D115C1D
MSVLVLDFVPLVGCVLYALLVGLLTRRLVSHEWRERQNTMTGAVTATICTLLVLLLSFVIVTIWQSLSGAQATVAKEVDSLGTAYYAAQQVDDQQARLRIEHQILDYADRVINVEWPLMASHRSDATATGYVHDMRDEAYALTPSTAQQQLVQDHLVTHLETLSEFRRDRITAVSSQVPGVLWALLGIGAAGTIGLTALLGTPSGRMHMALLLSTAVIVGFALTFVNDLSFPFDGLAKVTPTSFKVFLSRVDPPR